MTKITGDDIVRIAMANPDIDVPADVAALGKSTRRNKYGAVRVDFAGMKFDSKAEFRRYGSLRLLELIGEIDSLEHHKVFELHAGIKYESDFTYRIVATNQQVVEDVKSKPTTTQAFRLKWKMAQQLYPEYEWRIVS